MLASMPATRPLTLDDVARLAENVPEGRFELVDGNLITVPPATIRHQKILLDLVMWLSNRYGHRVILTPGVRMSSDNNLNGRIPDLVVTTGSVDGATVWIDPSLIALAVEVVSEGSQRTDRWFKPLEYARAGIARYRAS